MFQVNLLRIYVNGQVNLGGPNTKETVMRKFQSAALAAVLAAATALGLAAAGATASATTGAAGHATRPASASRSVGVAANEREVRAFLRDVIDEHHGDHAGRYLTR